MLNVLSRFCRLASVSAFLFAWRLCSDLAILNLAHLLRRLTADLRECTRSEGVRRSHDVNQLSAANLSRLQLCFVFGRANFGQTNGLELRHSFVGCRNLSIFQYSRSLSLCVLCTQVRPLHIATVRSAINNVVIKGYSIPVSRPTSFEVQVISSSDMPHSTSARNVRRGAATCLAHCHRCRHTTLIISRLISHFKVFTIIYSPARNDVKTEPMYQFSLSSAFLRERFSNVSFVVNPPVAQL
jgi:hypothetical protein